MEANFSVQTYNFYTLFKMEKFQWDFFRVRLGVKFRINDLLGFVLCIP